MRTPFVAGNWKMNLTLQQSLDLVKGIHYGLPNPGPVDVLVAPPFTALSTVANFLKDSYIAVAGQNMHWKDSGAFTGEISGHFLKDAGADYVILGHSERRQQFGETNEMLNKKVKAAFECDLTPIYCVGETLDERESGQLESVLSSQIFEGLADLASEKVSDLLIAYEPVWAIGTGKTASPSQAQEVHQMIRDWIAGQWGQLAAQKTRILYGGSVSPSSAKDLFACADIDGALVGGASLQPTQFIEIIRSFPTRPTNKTP